MRPAGLKERHKGPVYGVYVTRAQRGRGLGRALKTALLERTCGFETYGTEPRATNLR